MRAILPLLVMGTGCMVAAPEPPPTSRSSADAARTEWRIHIDTKDRGIGAYTISIRWNADVAAIAEIVPCSPRYFKGTPEYDPASFTMGQTRVASLDVFGSKPKSGPWHLFTVIFRRSGPGTLVANAQIEKLYDDENKPSTGRLIDAEFRTTFP
jgi:hypothetical protein